MSAEPGEELQMTFWEHLAELRSRLMRALLAFVVGLAVAGYFHELLLALVAKPLVQGWNTSASGQMPSLHFAEPQAAFFAYLKLAMLGGFVVALPFMLYQVWAFVAPGLYARERRFALPFVFSSTGLFALGSYYGWKVVYPIAFQFLLGLGGRVEGAGVVLDVQPTLMIDEYLDFVIRMSLALGAVFELPVLVFFLAVAGLVNHQDLIRFWRYFVVVAFLVAAVITPPDLASQFFVAIPLCLLYFLSIGIARMFSRKAITTTSALTPTKT